MSIISGSQQSIPTDCKPIIFDDWRHLPPLTPAGGSGYNPPYQYPMATRYYPRSFVCRGIGEQKFAFNQPPSEPARYFVTLSDFATKTGFVQPDADTYGNSSTLEIFNQDEYYVDFSDDLLPESAHVNYATNYPNARTCSYFFFAPRYQKFLWPLYNNVRSDKPIPYPFGFYNSDFPLTSQSTQGVPGQEWTAFYNIFEEDAEFTSKETLDWWNPEGFTMFFWIRRIPKRSSTTGPEFALMFNNKAGLDGYHLRVLGSDLAEDANSTAIHKLKFAFEGNTKQTAIDNGTGNDSGNWELIKESDNVNLLMNQWHLITVTGKPGPDGYPLINVYKDTTRVVTNRGLGKENLHYDYRQKFAGIGGPTRDGGPQYAQYPWEGDYALGLGLNTYPCHWGAWGIFNNEFTHEDVIGMYDRNEIYK